MVNGVKDKEDISVLPIIFIGSVGKTTIAQLICNDPRVAEHVETKLKNFDVKTLVKAMIKSATNGGSALLI